tara:strand:+ start:25784 stop:26065 length:282 start_codon:yes stop_codon:yes gene_type:complete
MEAKTVNKLLMGGGCLMVAFALFYGGKSESKVEVKESEYVIPEKFKNDVNQMSNEEINKAIKDNTNYLATAKMLPETRKAIESMLNYLKSKRG